MNDLERSIIYPYRICRNYSQGYMVYRIYKYNVNKHRYDSDGSFLDHLSYDKRMIIEIDLHEIVKLIKTRIEQERIRAKPDEWVSEEEVQAEFL